MAQAYQKAEVANGGILLANDPRILAQSCFDIATIVELKIKAVCYKRPRILITLLCAFVVRSALNYTTV